MMDSWRESVITKGMDFILDADLVAKPVHFMKKFA